MKSRINGLIWYWCTKCKRNGHHETKDFKIKIKARSYAATLAAEDTSMVGDSGGNSDIDEPPTRSTKKVKIEFHKRK